jgi:hypothetical protein
MALLSSLLGRGGGRVPLGGASLALSRDQLADVVRTLALGLAPGVSYARALQDLEARPDAPALLREAAAAYVAALPQRAEPTPRRRPA